jgi:hypothetical protein
MFLFLNTDPQDGNAQKASNTLDPSVLVIVSGCKGCTCEMKRSVGLSSSL